MTRIEKFKTIENYLQESAKHELKSIEKDGFQFYAERYYKHIDLLTYPEEYMTDKEIEEKTKVIKRIKILKERAKGNIYPAQLELYLWDGCKNFELSSWGWEINI